MKIAIIGATGNVGSRLVDEASSRRHQVTAVARNASRLPPDEKLTFSGADATDPEQLSRALAGHDVVISATPFRQVKPESLIGRASCRERV